jgi:hypothetical protein
MASGKGRAEERVTDDMVERAETALHELHDRKNLKREWPSPEEIVRTVLIAAFDVAE